MEIFKIYLKLSPKDMEVYRKIQGKYKRLSEKIQKNIRDFVGKYRKIWKNIRNYLRKYGKIRKNIRDYSGKYRKIRKNIRDYVELC